MKTVLMFLWPCGWRGTERQQPARQRGEGGRDSSQPGNVERADRTATSPATGQQPARQPDSTQPGNVERADRTAGSPARWRGRTGQLAALALVTFLKATGRRRRRATIKIITITSTPTTIPTCAQIREAVGQLNCHGIRLCH